MGGRRYRRALEGGDGGDEGGAHDPAHDPGAGLGRALGGGDGGGDRGAADARVLVNSSYASVISLNLFSANSRSAWV